MVISSRCNKVISLFQELEKKTRFVLELVLFILYCWCVCSTYTIFSVRVYSLLGKFNFPEACRSNMGDVHLPKRNWQKKSFDQGRRRHRLLLYFTIFIIQRSVNKYFPIFILPLVRKIRSTFARVAWPDRGTIGGIIKWLKTTYTGLQKRPLLKVFKLAVTGGL